MKVNTDVISITRRDKVKWSPLFEDGQVDEAFWGIAGRKFRDVSGYAFEAAMYWRDLGCAQVSKHV